jgi:hypothetical protein
VYDLHVSWVLTLGEDSFPLCYCLFHGSLLTGHSTTEDPMEVCVVCWVQLNDWLICLSCAWCGVSYLLVPIEAPRQVKFSNQVARCWHLAMANETSRLVPDKIRERERERYVLQQNIGLYFSPQLGQLYRSKVDNICQSIWDKIEMLWRTCWRTHWELIYCCCHQSILIHSRSHRSHTCH